MKLKSNKDKDAHTPPTLRSGRSISCDPNDYYYYHPDTEAVISLLTYLLTHLLTYLLTEGRTGRATERPSDRAMGRLTVRRSIMVRYWCIGTGHRTSPPTSQPAASASASASARRHTITYEGLSPMDCSSGSSRHRLMEMETSCGWSSTTASPSISLAT